MEHDPVESLVYFVRLISKWLKYPILATAIIWIITWFAVDILPPPSTILPQLYQEPVQEMIDADPFTITYHGKETDVEPVATYTIWGLVVSHNHPTGIDISHDQYSIDTRDLCVVWGDDVKTDIYKQVSFSNLDWECEAKYQLPTEFKADKFSNNHLITNKEEIRRQIADVHIGDQIMITGKLVNYAEKRWEGHYRHTSLTREDTGDGACEIIFVEDIKILKPSNVFIRLLHDVSCWLFIGLIGFRILLFFFFPMETSRLR